MGEIWNDRRCGKPGSPSHSKESRQPPAGTLPGVAPSPPCVGGGLPIIIAATPKHQRPEINPMKKLLFPRYLLRAMLSVPHLGILGSIKLLAYQYIKKEFVIRCRTVPNPLVLRGRTTDLSVAYTILCHKDYDFQEIRDVAHVLDCGAYIGISTRHLRNTLGAKTAIAVEPNPGNFELLAKNCDGDKTIRCIHGAIWHEKKMLQIANPSAQKYAFKCTEAVNDVSSNPIEAYTMSELLDEMKNGRILVKMDIEGAEKDVFISNPEWLSRIDYLIMEIHPGCWKAVFDAMATYDYDCRFSGENILFIFRR
jgi:FkbM family methyltransferase